MNYTSQGPGWWQASDGRWYPPEQHPSAVFAYRYPTRQSTNGFAIASLVLAIVGLLGIGAILAIIFGIVARRQIRESGGAQTGEGLALAGIIVGICQIALSAAAIAFLVIGLSSTLPRVLGPLPAKVMRTEFSQRCRIIETTTVLTLPCLQHGPTPAMSTTTRR